MPAPAFVAAGTPVYSANNVAASTSLSPISPAGAANGNLLVLVTNTRSITATCATPSGWNLVTGFPQRSATASGGSIYVFTRIHDGSSADDPSAAWTGLTSGTNGDSTSARIVAYSDATEVRDAIGTKTDAAATTSFNIPAITTTTANALVIGIGMRVNDTAHTFTVASPYTERSEGHTTSGTGHGTEVSETIKATAGVQAAVAITPSNTTSSRVLAMSVAFVAIQDKAASDSTQITSADASSLSISVDKSASDSTQITSSETSDVVPSSPPLISEEETFESATVSDPVTTGTILDDNFNGTNSFSEISSANPTHGTKHARFNSILTTSRGGINLPAGSSTIYTRWYLMFDTLPISSANQTIALFFDTSSTSTVRAGVQLQAAGTIRIRNGLSAVATSTATFTANTRYRLEWKFDFANTVQELRIWTGATLESDDPADAMVLNGSDKFLSGTLNTGTTGRFVVGANDTGNTNIVHDIDSIAWGEVDWIGPFDIGETPISDDDATEISSSETTSLQASFSATDTTQITSSETTAILSTLARTDATEISSAETAAILSTLARTDATQITSAETAAILSTLSRTDATEISSSETSAVVVQISSADSTQISSSETQTSQSALSRTDTTQITSADASSFATVAFTRTDTTQITSADVGSTTASFPGSDATLIGSSETSEVIATGTFDKSSSDSTEISSAETAVNAVSLSRTDTTQITSAETASFAQVNFSTTDSTQITSAETAAIQSSLSRTDSTDIGSSETSAIMASFTRTDATDIGSSETSSILSTLSRPDTTEISSTETRTITSTLSRTDSTEISSSETAAFATSAFTRTDSTQITSADAGAITAVTLHLSSTDSTQISSSETSDVDLGSTQLIRHHERFNGGSNGVAITSGNSLFTLFPGTGTMEFSTDYAIQGGTSGKFVSTNAAQGKRGKIENLVSRRTWYMRFYYRKVGNPSGVNRFAIFETAAGAVPPGEDIAGIREETNGNLTLFNGSSWATGTPISSLANGWHRIELKVDRDGALSTLRVWSGANIHSTGTADQEIQVALADNGNEISVVGVGNYNAVNQTRYIEDFAVGDQAWIGPTASIDLSAADSTEISSSETSAITVPITSSDSTSITSTETTTILSTLSRTDSTEITSTEGRSFGQVNFTRTDTTDIGSAETASVFINNPGSDATQISSSETADIQVIGVIEKSSSDSTEISSSETGAPLVSLTRPDTTEVTSAETASFGQVNFTRTDSTNITSAETAAINSTLSRTDSTEISSSETAAFGTVAFTRTDATEITSAESTSNLVSLTRPDSTQITSAEQVSFPTIQFSSADTTAITSADLGIPQAQFPGADSTIIGSSETADIQASGGSDISGSDATVITSEDASSLVITVFVTSSDSTQIGSTDTSSFGQVNFTRTDATEIGSTETAVPAANFPGSDTTVIGSSETADVQQVGNITVSSSDSTALGASETAVIVSSLSRADSTALEFSEAAQIAGTVTSADTTEITSTETRSFNVQAITGTDSTQISSTETSDVYILITITSDDFTEITSVDVGFVGQLDIGAVTSAVRVQDGEATVGDRVKTGHYQESVVGTRRRGMSSGGGSSGGVSSS